MEKKKLVVHLTAQNQEGKTKKFIESLDNVGELLNNIILSGYRNIADIEIKEDSTNNNSDTSINIMQAYNASVAEGLV